jgi:hypothetical protein
MEVAGNLDGDVVVGFFLAVKMALEFDVDILAAKNAGQMLDRAGLRQGLLFLARQRADLPRLR